ncbi:MAG TPA: hypothetical protein VFM41_03350 [Gaiella sp.]|nr:hypothetical protein [Gaiella sp.]
MRCERCDGELDQRFRFCPWCSAPQRLKLVAHFRGDPLIERLPVGLRVSRYLVARRHVRLSIWDEERAVAAVALEEGEAARLASFLALGEPRRRRRFRDDVRVSAIALRRELSRR